MAKLMDLKLRIRNLSPGRASAGFTLTELLVALLIGLLVLEGVHRIFVAGLTTQYTTSNQTEVNRKAQVGADTIISKLRGSSEVKDAAANRICFLDQEGHNIRFWLDGGSLVYRDWGVSDGSYTGGTPVASNVSIFDLDYYDANGQPTAAAANTCAVAVELEVKEAGQSTHLRSNVRLRNK
jgi:prepilin-type N-terminal cleavage/methylation domain-containing protein